MGHFRDLEVWRHAHQLTLQVYRVTKRFPREELYGLTSQIRRATSSIELNISEGCGRKRDTELRRYLEIARGSASEVENLLLLCFDLEYLSDEEHRDLSDRLDRISRMLTSFSVKLRSELKPVNNRP
ncbi:MAG: four helix bundle protein [Acidobacteriaceae bacterium]